MNRGLAFALLLTGAASLSSPAGAAPADLAVGPQYDSTHVYAPADQVEPFITSFIATFGGHTSKPASVTVTPTPSVTLSQVVFTPAGFASVFGFKTPIPYPFGEERTGYLVTDLDAAVTAARQAGAEVVVAPFNDPIGRDAIVRWPGGVNMQLYWHTTAPSYAPLDTIPENRIYLSADSVDAFVKAFSAFSGAAVVSDTAKAPGLEIGRPGEWYRRLRLTSPYGRMVLLVTDGHLPWPYGRELTGYEVPDVSATLTKAKAAGARIVAGPYSTADREAAVLQFPGGYVAEVHTARKP